MIGVIDFFQVLILFLIFVSYYTYIVLPLAFRTGKAGFS
jgi:hypothetical protein